MTTAQGDQGTLTCSSSLVEYTYIRPEAMDIPGLIDVRESRETVSIEVQGELSQEEKEGQGDIAALQKDQTDLISSSSETQGYFFCTPCPVLHTWFNFDLSISLICKSIQEAGIACYPVVDYDIVFHILFDKK